MASSRVSPSLWAVRRRRRARDRLAWFIWTGCKLLFRDHVVLNATHPKAALVLLNVFLLSFSGLLLQISMTRIFSIYLWYHYSFAVVSIALFGWGFGGLLIHFRYSKGGRDELSFTSALLLILGASIPLYIIVLPFVPLSVVWFYLLSVVPFFIAGIGIAFLYSRFASLSDRLYFSDLGGASLACLVAEPVVLSIGIESSLMLLGVLIFSVALALSFQLKVKARAIVGLVGLTTLSIFVVANVQFSYVTIGNVSGKALHSLLANNPNLRVTRTMWNSYSRIDVVEGYGDQNHVLAEIFIDADASTEVLKWNGSRLDLQDLPPSLDALPYHLVNSSRSLIVGPGGGKDILYAIAGGSAQVVGVELNPLIVQAVNDFGSQVGNIYSNHPNISLFVDEGRSFIERSNAEYDIISLTLVDTWASIYGGGYALAENYLYTKEAFLDYINHLSDNGVLMMVRWSSEIPKLVSTATEAYRSLGLEKAQTRARMAVIFNDIGLNRTKALFVLKKTPFTFEEAAILDGRVAALGGSYWAFLPPRGAGDPEPYASFFNNSITNEQFYSSFDSMVKPVTDDCPYHFNFEFGIPSTLSGLLALSLLLTCGFILMPVAAAIVKHRASSVDKISRAACSSLLLVSLLGIGYIMIEIVMMQRFILFLGYPTRAISVILFSLLLSSGTGSLASGRLIQKKDHLISGMMTALLLVVAVTCLYGIYLNVIFDALISQDALVRIAISVVLLFPLGFFMGIPFPSTLRLVSEHSATSKHVSWLWAVNGAMSVLGSTVTTVVSMLSGFSVAMLMGACIYGAALVTVGLSMRLSRPLNVEDISR
jgi:hypothetical protein